MISWNYRNVSKDPNHEPQFLYALKGTAGGDRQVVWEAGSDRGIIAVVDFADASFSEDNRYWKWGCGTLLPRPLSPSELQTHPGLEQRFSASGRKAFQGSPIRLTAEEGVAIDEVAGGLPEQRVPQRQPTGDDPAETWFGSVPFDLEKKFELAVARSASIWRKVGFVSAPVMQQRLDGSPTLIPDLIAPGLVGEVKRSISLRDGPVQIMSYLQRLNETEPVDGGWRGALLHADELASSVREHLVATTAGRVAVWRIEPGRLRQWKAVREL